MTAAHRSAAARFERFVSPEPNTGCHAYTGSIQSRGYGCFAFGGKGKNILAHRFAYELRVGPIPDGLTLDHLCRNRWCVNPAHLEAVTSATNTLRGNGFSGVNARKTHCLRGHPLSGANLQIQAGTNKRGCRRCRKCVHAKNSRAAARKRTAAQLRDLPLFAPPSLAPAGGGA